MSLTIARISALLLIAPSLVTAADPWYPVNNYGEPGLLQTPTARFTGEGSLSIGISDAHPYNRLFFTHQPLSFLAGTFRYTETTNRRYGPESFSGDQSHKDRSVDLRFKLFDEGSYSPAVALGVRDFGGTALFGAEYLVASRRYYDLDISIGLGWGRLGSGGELQNPFGSGRERVSGNGTPEPSNLFAGERVGVFGGLAWRTPVTGLVLNVERDPNDFRSEPSNNTQDVRFPLNFGMVYRPTPWFEAAAGWERGDIITARLSVQLNLDRQQGIPKLHDPRPPIRLGSRSSARIDQSSESADFVNDLELTLRDQQIQLSAAGISHADSSATATVTTQRYRQPEMVIERAALAMNIAAPASVKVLRLRQTSDSLPMYEVRLARADVESRASGYLSKDNLLLRAEYFEAPSEPVADLTASPITPYPDLRWSASPGLRQHIGGPDGFYIAQLWWRLGADVDLIPAVNLSTAIGLNIYNNFDRLKLASDSELPHVRSDIVQYLQQGETALVRMEANSLHAFSPDIYGRLSAGIFEEMYGGIAGELLYRPALSNFAVGLDLNRVRQRDFNQRFDFRDYEATTGHLTTYYRWRSQQLLFKTSAGQYLAGDRGITVDIAREYRNGIRVGAFVTRTNVPAEVFGEGSFDKGIYCYIPFDLFLTRSSQQGGTLLFRPLTRDGGQKVRDGKELYSITDLGQFQNYVN